MSRDHLKHGLPRGRFCPKVILSNFVVHLLWVLRAQSFAHFHFLSSCSCIQSVTFRFPIRSCNWCVVPLIQVMKQSMVVSSSPATVQGFPTTLLNILLWFVLSLCLCLAVRVHVPHPQSTVGVITESNRRNRFFNE